MNVRNGEYELGRFCTVLLCFVLRYHEEMVDICKDEVMGVLGGGLLLFLYVL